MADSPTDILPPGLVEAKQRLLEQRRRLDRIAERYAQLETALETLESLTVQYLPFADAPESETPETRPRKPR